MQPGKAPRSPHRAARRRKSEQRSSLIVHGGTVQGLGTALYEECLYDAQGRVRNESFEYYHLPSSMDVPTMTVSHQETPSPYTPYGIKGAGEGGRMLTPAILSAAIEDALAPYGVRITSLPISAEQIVAWANP